MRRCAGTRILIQRDNGGEGFAMCMIDNTDGMVTELHSETRKAVKEHKCSECRRLIGKGELYLHEGYVWDGKKHTHKTCRHCQVVRDWLSAECGGWCYGSVEEDIWDHVNDGYYGKAVVMLAVGMRRYWRTKDGRLYRVPSVPKTSHQRAA